jgi:hypothetical protein
LLATSAQERLIHKHKNQKRFNMEQAALVLEATQKAIADEHSALVTQIVRASRSLGSVNILLRRARDSQNVAHAAATLLARKTHTPYVLRSAHT